MSNKLRCRLLASDPGTPMFVISLSGLHDRNRTELAIKLMYVGMMAEATATLTEATRNKDDVVPAMHDANASCNPLIPNTGSLDGLEFHAYQESFFFLIFKSFLYFRKILSIQKIEHITFIHNQPITEEDLGK